MVQNRDDFDQVRFPRNFMETMYFGLKEVVADYNNIAEENNFSKKLRITFDKNADLITLSMFEKTRMLLLINLCEEENGAVTGIFNAEPSDPAPKPPHYQEITCSADEILYHCMSRINFYTCNAGEEPDRAQSQKFLDHMTMKLGARKSGSAPKFH